MRAKQLEQQVMRREGPGWRKGLGDGVKVKVTQAVYPLHNGRN